MKILRHLALGLLLITVSALTALAVAHADPKPGLWLEDVTLADGVTIRKIRDTTGGDLNVCYVASNRTNNVPGSVAVAISCLPEKHP